MKRYLMLLSMFVASILLVGCTATIQAPNPEEQIAAAEALDTKFMAALNGGNAEALAACYWNSPDVVNCPPDEMMVKGRDAIKTGTAAMFENFKGMHVELIEHHNVPAGEVVLGYGTFRMTIPGPDGDDIEVLGRFTDVKAERDGEWVYIMDHASVPLPPPPSEM